LCWFSTNFYADFSTIYSPNFASNFSTHRFNQFLHWFLPLIFSTDFSIDLFSDFSTIYTDTIW
jgi:hypothetical protein